MSEKKTIKQIKRAFSPNHNPLMEATVVPVAEKKRFVRTSKSQELVDPTTGEVRAISMVHTVEQKDSQEFVKVFADGVKASFGLSRAAGRVFVAVLEAYQNEKMTGGYADCVTLFWFNEGLNGDAIDMSERTFNRGLKELLEKDFLSPKIPSVYWVNPALFFKGDRVAFVREYRLRKPNSVESGETADMFNGE